MPFARHICWTRDKVKLLMRNNKLARELSFMPPAMGQKLAQAKNQRFKIYLEQRTNPHHLIPDTVKKVEYCFVPADMSDPNIEKLQQDETVTSIEDLLAEVDDVMSMTGLKWDIPIGVGDNLEQIEDGEIPPEGTTFRQRQRREVSRTSMDF